MNGTGTSTVLQVVFKKRSSILEEGSGTTFAKNYALRKQINDRNDDGIKNQAREVAVLRASATAHEIASISRVSPYFS
jgi:hypothetical protein